MSRPLEFCSPTPFKYRIISLTVMAEPATLSHEKECSEKRKKGGGGRGSVGRACDFESRGRRFDPHSGRPLPTGWVGVSIV